MPSPNQMGAVGSPMDDEFRGDRTPKTWKDGFDGDGIPDGPISEWDEHGVAEWITSLGLGKYHDDMIKHGMVGMALIHSNHDDLRSMGITSVGHRLTILKNVYNMKVAHDIPIEDGDYIPVSADIDDSKTATQEDIQRLIAIIRQRDQRIHEAESVIQTLQESMQKLRTDLLPVWRMVKNQNDQLPVHPDDRRGVGDEQVQDPTPSPNLQPAPTSGGRSISRKLSVKKMFNKASQPKISSPTFSTNPHDSTASTGLYEPHSGPFRDTQSTIATSPMPNSTFHGSGTTLGAYEPHPSPTSPGLSTHHYTPSVRGHPQHTPRTPATQPSRSGHRNDDDHSDNVKEIFKSFRVSMDDPCHKVLPAALKRYNIQADPRDYCLYIVHGDQERCLRLDERPLILFKQLDRDGRKPMFMLRKNQNAGGQQVPIGGHPQMGHEMLMHEPPGGVL